MMTTSSGMLCAEGAAPNRAAKGGNCQWRESQNRSAANRKDARTHTVTPQQRHAGPHGMATPTNQPVNHAMMVVVKKRGDGTTTLKPTAFLRGRKMM